MTVDSEKTYKGKCIDCNSILELYQIDFAKGQRTMQCTHCGLFHFYKKNFVGKWKLIKAGRASDF
ncbi:MAG: hypothetical protein PVF96_02510 [Candidatus Bathyarchaeota archaeon]